MASRATNQTTDQAANQARHSPAGHNCIDLGYKLDHKAGCRVGRRRADHMADMAGYGVGRMVDCKVGHTADHKPAGYSYLYALSTKLLLLHFVKKAFRNESDDKNDNDRHNNPNNPRLYMHSE